MTLPIQFDPSKVSGIFGPVRSGKTHLINEYLRTQNRFVRFDVTGETMNDATVIHVWGKPLDVWKLVKASPYYFRIAYHPGADMEDDFHSIVKVLWWQDVSKLLVCDEIHEVCSLHMSPSDPMTTWLRYARHARLGILGASQQIKDVSPLFLSACFSVVLFNPRDARGLDTIERQWGPIVANDAVKLNTLIYSEQTQRVERVPQCIEWRLDRDPQARIVILGGNNDEQSEHSDPNPVMPELPKPGEPLS